MANNQATTENIDTARYIFRMGITVTDDVIKKTLTHNPNTSLLGAFIIRIKKPVPCLFITYGYNGYHFPNMPFNAMEITINEITKEESHALSCLMSSIAVSTMLPIYQKWVFIDLKESEARVLIKPTATDVANMYQGRKKMRQNNIATYKVMERISRRRTTLGSELPDGHEDDSDADPIMAYLDQLEHKETKAQKMEQKKYGLFKNTAVSKALLKIQTKHERKRYKRKYQETETREEPISKPIQKEEEDDDSLFMSDSNMDLPTSPTLSLDI